ncbi:general stress protein CsbD [Bradyrhizobium sp. CCBAU 45321]|uniref:CsbD family protein n=1 Tax=Bradyrhizobium sp. CCBAU 45321 TaxID=1641878 RepID=UPI002302FA4E|nr:CsbD family protein [Bradyrhizobium sp. CCBAU 45321]MDA9547575.1 general stress protein CsbD [Bradyrhizobium sp. CCBAU 45321]
MDREHVKGLADKAKGAIHQRRCRSTYRRQDVEAEGKIDKATGSAHNTAGDVKDAERDAADALKK